MKRKFKITTFFVLALLINLTLLTLNCFPQNNHEHHKHQIKNASIKKDSTIKIIDALKRDDGAGEAIIIQCNRDDKAADKWIQEYIKNTKDKLNTLKQGKSSGCSNLDFEDGNFNSWTGQTGVNNGYPAGSWVNGIVAGRHTIVSGGSDPYASGANPIPLPAPNGGIFSVKLGNDNTNYQAERLIYTFTVQPQDTNFIYKYAVVLQDPQHTPSEQPYFDFQILDQSGNVIPCSYQHYVAGGGLSGFFVSPAASDVSFKPWTTVGINLSTWVGQQITIIATTADCAQGAHFGYAYLDFICPSSFSSSPNIYCDTQTSVVINAPMVEPGMTFNWSTGQTGSSITINPQLYDGSSINCFIESPTSVGLCGFWYVFPIQIFHFNPEFTFTTNCLTANFTDASTVNIGSIQNWLWNFGDGNTSATQNSSHTYSNAGTYNVTLTITTAYCGQKIITHPVTVTGMSLSMNSTNITCINTNATATVTATGAPPYIYVWTPSPPVGQGTNSVSNLSAGTYTVAVSDGSGCSSTASCTITEPSTFQITLTSTDVTCFGSSDGSITVSTSGGTPPYTYLWSNSQTDSIASNLPANTYSVVVTDAGGCTTTQSAVVNEPPQLIITATATPNAICYGDTSVLTANNASTYIWSPSTGLSSTSGTQVSAYPVTTTTYVVIGTNAAGCTASTQITVTVSPLPIINITGTTPICSGQSSVLTAHGGVSYIWNPSATGDNITVSPLMQTVYYVTGTDANGCENTAQFTVNVVQMPVANAGNDDAVCSLTYQMNAVPSLGAGTWTGSGPGTVMFSDIYGPTAILTVSANGIYTLIWTENNGNNCIDSDTVTVQLTQIPTSDFTVNNIPCFGGTTTVTYTGTGTSQYQFMWNYGGGIAVPGNGTGPHTLSYQFAGTYQVSLTVSLNGCSSAPTAISVIHPPKLQDSYVQTNELCYGDYNGSIDLTVTGGTPGTGYTYLWSNTYTTEDISGITQGMYYVIVTDSNHCTIADTVEITGPDKLLITTSPDQIICMGDYPILSVTATGGTGAYHYHWSTSASTQSITVHPVINTSYTVYVTDDNNCQSVTNSITINVLPGIEINLYTDNDSVCPGYPANIFAWVTGGDGGPYYLYDVFGSMIDLPYIVFPFEDSNYILVARDKCGSKDRDTIRIYTLPEPIVVFTADKLRGCVPLQVLFNPQIYEEGSGYLWNFGDNMSFSTAMNPTHIFETAGEYDITLTITNKYGCNKTLTIADMISAYPLPDARFTPVPEYISILNPEVEFNNYSQGAISYIWSFGDGDSSEFVNPVHYYPAIGKYNSELIAISNHGCKDTLVVPLVVHDEYTFYAPTSFSPDNDGINDVFKVYGHGINPESFILYIYDRWGELIYKSENIETGWDGRYGGKKVKSGTYTWLVNFKYLSGVQQTKSGPVTVIR
ncbi:MAG: gliding motility-associated C-terminal domain-containing protein [Bacteroidia bacterium]|nr:gliding motility-associated C-terminal domain-containing protein [Bacteroidia bacterium]